MEAYLDPVVLGAFPRYSLLMSNKFPLINKPAIVYQATNRLNGKRYIGATTKTLEQRRARHACEAPHRVNGGAFHAAIRKYGIETFDWCVLSRHDTAKDAAKEEKRLIAEATPDYNSTPGGLGFHVRVWSESSRLKASISGKERYKRMPHPMLGYKPSAEQRRKTAERMRGTTGYWKGKTLPLHVCAMISERMARRPDKQRVLSMGPKTTSRRVVCLNDGKDYESARAASRAYNVCSSQIIAVCKRSRHRRSAAGLVFRYWGEHAGGEAEALRIIADVRDARVRTAANARTYQTTNGRDKPLRCENDGQVFNSIKDAAAYYGKHEQTIADICHGRRAYRNKKQLRFTFIDGVIGR